MQFIIKIINEGENGKIYIPYQNAVSLSDLVDSVVKLYGDEKTKIKTISTRAGERKHEILFAEDEAVVCSVESRHSDKSPQISREHIKEWLNQTE